MMVQVNVFKPSLIECSNGVVNFQYEPAVTGGIVSQKRKQPKHFSRRLKEINPVHEVESHESS
jgi:hypothetical protein